MKRRDFVMLAAAVPLLGAAAPGRDVAIPVEMRGGRFFAVPKTLDGRTFACWLDTDGGGFVLGSAVERFHLSSRVEAGRTVARLPAFSPDASVPPLAIGETLEVLLGDNLGPVFEGYEAQLGKTWFAQRVWHLDFANGTLRMLASPISPAADVVALSFQDGAPCVPVRAGDDPDELTMSIDIAATVVYSPRFARGDNVVATSFIRNATMRAWRERHPDWTFQSNVSPVPGVDQIVVPKLFAGGHMLENVAFTTRPNDDLFAGSPLTGKLGANAYARESLWIDYPNARLRFRAASEI